MAKIIPSSDIGVKINKWYELIRRFDSEQAEQLKQEIRTSLDSMEEDQNLLLYFSLMEFRHEVMLDYLKPLKEGKLRANFSELSKEIDEHQTHVTGMLEYYYHFLEACMNSGGGSILLPYRLIKRQSTSFLLYQMILNVRNFILKCQKYIIT